MINGSILPIFFHDGALATPFNPDVFEVGLQVDIQPEFDAPVMTAAVEDRSIQTTEFQDKVVETLVEYDVER